MLIGGIAAGTLTSCGPSTPPVTANSVFTNNHYVPGVGYYHAPFRAWYALPYNHYDAKSSRYYQGGQWAPAPHESVVNMSSPTPQALQRIAAQRRDVPRSGFGGTSHRHHISS